MLYRRRKTQILSWSVPFRLSVPVLLNRTSVLYNNQVGVGRLRRSRAYDREVQITAGTEALAHSIDP